MDKFGIFNLLSSLANASAPKNDASSDQKNNPPLDFSGMINSLLSTKKDTPTTPPKNQPPKEFMPLQRSMLGVMTSHDEFIKRVKEKNHKIPDNPQ